MSANKVNRREFMKIVGLSGAGAALAGCDMPTTVTLEEGKERVVSYLVPEEYVIPGIGVWFASTCQACPAGCGFHGRVREGRVLKLEGNPDSPINYSKLCQMGQASLQTHYNPDRLTQPLLRQNGELSPVSWDEAFKLLESKIGAGSGVSGDKFAWVTGTVSGHQAVLIKAHLEAINSGNHFVHEVINTAVGQAVSRDTLGDPRPRYRLDRAKAVLSFGADFLGTWNSPVHFATQYAKFRAAPRGVLIQAEPAMSLTGANADLWLPVRPGTEGVLALGIANSLIFKHHVDASHLPLAVRNLIANYPFTEVAKVTGVSGDLIERAAAMLKKHSPSLVISGPSAEGHAHGYESATAVMLLNILLGNVGQTIEPGHSFPLPQLAAREGNTADLLSFAEGLKNKRFDTVFFYGTNPVYTAPASLALEDHLAKVPFKVAFSMFRDETTALADLVLPIRSALEDWGTHAAGYQPGEPVLGFQQPLMEPLYQTTRGMGDLLLALLKMQRASDYAPFADYYAYLNNFAAGLPAGVRHGAANDKEFWQATLQTGLIKLVGEARTLNVSASTVVLPAYKADSEYQYHLVPAARLGMWDGRHANLPWLQEAPDQITKTVWDSWVEMHPATAAKFDVKVGDYVRVSSAQGSIEAQAFIYKGIQKDAIAVPMGRGHTEYGRYNVDPTGKPRGVNPLKILSQVTDSKTGELALFATRVRIEKTGRTHELVKMGGNDTQLGRKLAATITSDQFNRTEGGKTDVA